MSQEELDTLTALGREIAEHERALHNADPAPRWRELSLARALNHLRRFQYRHPNTQHLYSALRDYDEHFEGGKLYDCDGVEITEAELFPNRVLNNQATHALERWVAANQHVLDDDAPPDQRFFDAEANLLAVAHLITYQLDKNEYAYADEHLANLDCYWNGRFYEQDDQ